MSLNLPPNPTLDQIQEVIEELNQRHFDEQNYASTPFLIIALAGEVGEMCNEFKSIVRGADPVKHQEDIAKEAADVMVFLLMLCRAMGINITEELKKRLILIDQRGRDGYYNR